MRYNGIGKKEQARMNGRNEKRKDGIYGTWLEVNFGKRTLLDFCESVLKEVNL